MKKLIIYACLICPLMAFALEPATITITNLRSEAVSAASADTFYRLDQIVFTNCVVYSGTSSSSAVEDLTGVTVLLSWGDSVISGSSTIATVTSTAGVWGATVTLRTNDVARTYFQVQLTNSTTRFTYPLKYIDVRSKL